MGLLGWVAFAAVNLLGTAVIVGALLGCLVGTLAPHRAVAFVLLVALAAPFVWVGTLRLLPVRPAETRSLG